MAANHRLPSQGLWRLHIAEVTKQAIQGQKAAAALEVYPSLVYVTDWHLE